jgi:transporter family-2 protein
MKILAIVVALGCGAALAIQVGTNSTLRAWLGNPILAALVSFSIGTLALLGYVACLPPARPSTAALREAPWWIWMGGLLGAVYVASAAAFAPRLGSAGWLGLIVTGQVVTALVLDHWGLVGFPIHPINVWRIVGSILMVVGVTLVLRH